MDKQKITNRKIKALETKKKIYESAEKLFKRHGFDNVSVDSIVEDAGVAKGSFYVHFDSKDSIIASFAADYVYSVDSDYKAFLESLSDNIPAYDRLLLLVGKIADTIACTIGYDIMKIIYGVQIEKRVKANALLDYNRGLYKLFSDVIMKGMEEGQFKTEIPAETIVNHCIISLRGFTYEWCIRYPDFDLKAHVLEHFEIILTGIKK